MTRSAVGIAWFLLASAALGDEMVVDGRTFRLPRGLVVEKVAGPPLVDRPIVAEFDDRGRLYVADSSGSNDNVRKQLEDRPHRIVRLEDSDDDGRYDRSVVFADRMMFPAGAMWLDGSLYVAAPPSIWKLTDVDGDGVADRREEWFAGKTLTGCANDLHGPYAGPDGWVYWCKGAFAPQTYDRPGREPLATRAAHIFRARPDGTGIEPVMTGGMDNPVDVAFTHEGERIFTTTFLQHPGGGRRDGLIHALYGGVYGKDHDVLGGHVRTGPDLLPPMAHLGPAAPAGLVRASTSSIGQADDFYAACFNLRKVTRHRLQSSGGAYMASTEDFLATDDLDFHPTDVQEDADGSLLVVATGGWYKLCCPTSQLVKPDVLGAIYRVRPKGDRRKNDNWGRRIDWARMIPEAVAARVSDASPAIRRRAIAEMGRIGEPGIRDLLEIIQFADGHRSRIDALWAACRIDSPAARAACREGFKDRWGEVRQVAAHAAGLWRDRESVARLVALLHDQDQHLARVAAEALGRIGDHSAVPDLLGLAGRTGGWAVRHQATYALIEIGDPAATRPGLSSTSPGTIRAALIALDQMEGGGLEAASVLGALDSPDAGLRDAAWWVASRHPEWGESLARSIRGRLGRPAELPELESRLASLSRSAPIGELIRSELVAEGTSSPVRLAMLRAMAGSGLKETPGGWPEALARAVADPATAEQAVATAKALAIPPGRSGDLAGALLRAAGREDLPDHVRLGALGAVPGGLAKVEPSEFDFLLARLAPDQPASFRTGAVGVLAKARLSPDQYARLAASVASAGPLEIGGLLDAFDRASGPESGRALVEALRRSPARSTLRVESLRPRLARFGPGVGAEALFAAIEADNADRRGHLEALLGGLAGGDVRRGQQVFNSARAACSSCHAIGYVGGKLGPDLTRIGAVRGDRDLLESIVYPSASFVRSYEPVAVATRDGRVVSGILKQDAPDGVVVAVAADREERVARDQVEEMAPGTVSVMPAGLDRQLTPGELADLVAFLRACR